MSTAASLTSPKLAVHALTLNSLWLFPLGDTVISLCISPACFSHVEKTIHNERGGIEEFLGPPCFNQE